MPAEAQGLVFDFYDERWRDCWIAATSVTRLRKKQVDIDIQQRVVRLLEDYGPQSEKPLTLRIYGTMIKGFCVINNERAKVLHTDCERLVCMFARRPYAEGDNSIRLPAAKRPKMEAALTLDLDLARVEASEAFDWTQAPLEEGALLRLGGCWHLQQEMLPPTLDITRGDGFGVPPSLDIGKVGFFDGEAASHALGQVGGSAAEAGWLPRLDEGLGGLAVDGQAQDVPMSDQLVLAEALEPAAAAVPEASLPGTNEVQPAPADAAPGAAAQGSAIEPVVPSQVLRRKHEPILKPGVIFGFTNETMLSEEEYDRWQRDATELMGPRLRPSGYAESMPEMPEEAEHWGPRLRLLVDPPDIAFQHAASPPFQSAAASAAAPAREEVPLPDVQMLLGQGEVGQVPDPSAFQQPTADLVAMQEQQPVPMDVVELKEIVASRDAGVCAGHEAQDDRTAEVGNIIRGCLQRSGSGSVAFSDLVPPQFAERSTAACTFSALLALASAGELQVGQSQAYGQIIVSPAVAC
eukprot:gnl/TRDRNA2_/TRDRNA2_36553_c0_seq2.p1 gnl/TRDRNA2_/TRDRNA2_36553_c0~~gnl/TRDRNA2_/TRDRNA2_36553_c0_seq2.p1  ORF type:complete len:561 (+),score=134.85 gnl/TRDRNA2_/TRDRNA2_36553_c0_seq2:123-1685(+)